MVYCIARSLGLSVALKPMICEKVKIYYRDSSWQEKNNLYEYESTDGNLTNYAIPNFKSHQVAGGYEDDGHEEMKYFLEGLEELNTGDISWCQSPEVLEPLLSSVYYGNECSPTVTYQSAAFLVEVPKFTSKRGEAATKPSSECLPAKKFKAEECN